VPHLEPYPHHRGPLDVVDLGEGGLPAVGTDVPDNGLDPMVTMVPVRGGTAALPIKTAISINPATGASAPVWAAAAAVVRGTTAATVPLRMRGYPLRCLLSRYLPRLLELIVSVVVGRNKAASASGAQSLEFCRRRTRCICRRCCFYICQFCRRRPCPCAAVAAVSAVARSRSCAAETSAFCRCCTLKATKR
jgi:hypothetical protein